jgi:hypothetical protein
MALASVSLNVLGNNATQGVRGDRKYSQCERELNPDWWNRYWQTDLPQMNGMDEFRCHLKAKGFYYKAADQLPRLKELTKRCARGHQSYDACGVKGLKALVRGRGLELRVSRKANKRQLVRCLEIADDADYARNAMNATPNFHRFSELPPELRNRVYTFYFESLGKVPPRFVVPPLCKVSRQLRLETTALFFERSTFIILLRPAYSPQGQQRLYRHPAQLHYHSEVAKAIIPNPSFARIKHLCVEFKPWSNRASWATWAIDLSTGKSAREWPTRVQAYNGQSVQTFVDSIMAREGLAKLEKNDLDKLEVAINEAFASLRY